ncbi:ribosomal protein S18-alanine N-acetyltransferase [Oribacterium sp. FC2011]|uniref:ribosomal protein S18-alanine N-acetyltransferase n=1 Tax=Oribacterium sp. FC2011 TaxID=1408311 RepID=UPI0005D14787|nr:ribosomal protein S18-alanine N-acetyltransferase [Oribacterium sp. FC2011]
MITFNDIDFMDILDLPEVLALERLSFGKMAWSSKDFETALSSDYDYPMVVHKQPVNTSDQESFMNNLAGYSVLRLLGPEAEIENICVSPDMRRNGIGETLMQKMIQTALTEKASVIFLEVRAGNTPARALYQKLGFKELYVRKSYYRDPVDDAIIMQLNLYKK